jgi:hypothetical protein
MVAAVPLLTLGCTPVKHKSITGTLKASVIVTYAVTTESGSSARTTITYTDPLDGGRNTVSAKPAWVYSWAQVPAIQSTPLQVQVTGPDPGRSTCAIRIDGQQVTTDTGQTGQASGTPVTCNYTLSPAST